MSRNFLGIAISTSSISCVSSPVTPRRTPRNTPGSATFTAPAPCQSEECRSPCSAGLGTFSPWVSTPTIRASNARPRPMPFDISSATSSKINSPTENSLFLPRSPAATTPRRLCAAGHDNHVKLGTFSAINLILGKTIRVGIFSVPSSIFANVGSVGMALVVWLLAAIISFCGLAVYLDLGAALPQSGGEKVYLERIFKRPKFLATCVLMSYSVVLGFSTPNCIVAGEYMMYAMGLEANTWNVRSVAVLVITIACVVHARSPGLGLRLINVLGVIKMLIITTIIMGGLASISLQIGQTSEEAAFYKRNLTSLFAGTTTQPYAIASALLEALYCFRGYNTANQVLSEVRRPVRTLSIAAPSALLVVSSAYTLVNIAYFCAVERSDFASSGVVVAARFFTNVFGHVIGTKVLPWFIVLSAFGSIAATSFSQARVNQEFAKDGILPFSHFWASNEPYGTPAAALLLHWLVSVVVIIIPPPGRIYTFLVELGAYPVSVISVAIAGGLLYLQNASSERWSSPKPAHTALVISFLFTNLALLVLPWIRPESGRGSEDKFPYYTYPAAGLAVLLAGVAYWVWLSSLKERWKSFEAKVIDGALAGEQLALRDWKRDVKSAATQSRPL